MKSVFLFLVYVCLQVCMELGHGAPRRASPAQIVSHEYTTLRAEKPHVLFAGKQGVLESRLFSVRVKNVGAVDAGQIQIVLELESGLHVPLRGPKLLRARTSGSYTTGMKLPASLCRNPQIRICCESCRNYGGDNTWSGLPNVGRHEGLQVLLYPEID